MRTQIQLLTLTIRNSPQMHHITLTVSQNVLMNHIIKINNNFTVCIQSVRHQHAHMISDGCAHRNINHIYYVFGCASGQFNSSLDNVLFKVNPSLRPAFLQVVDVTNLFRKCIAA